MRLSHRPIALIFFTSFISTLMTFPSFAVGQNGEPHKPAVLTPYDAHDENSLNQALANMSDAGTIILTSDIAVAAPITVPVGKTVTIESATSTYAIRPDLSMTAGARVFNVFGNLVLQDVVVDGDNRNGGVYVDGGSLTLNGGAVVTRCNSGNGNGAGIRVVAGGALTIDGGEISHNQTMLTGGVSGGGIALMDSDAIMYNGTIHNNASVWGGGVSVSTESTFTMEGGNIQYNRTTIEHGGGVHVYVHGTFTMNGGTVSNNTAGIVSNRSYGGGVFVGQGTYTSGEPDDWCLFVMNGGTIKNNDAYVGGGVAAQWNGQLEIYDGLITSNTAQAGGGIAAVLSARGDDSVSLIMLGGEVSYNKAISSIGGGIWADSGAYLQRTKIVLGTQSGDNGVGPQIHHNIAAGNSGGGIALYRNAVADLYSGNIYENEAKQLGGGILLFNGSTLRMHGGSLSKNTAESDGGGICTNESGNALTITGGRVERNYTEADGGGIYLDREAVAVLADAIISDNTAKGNGGGVYTNTQDTSLSGLAISGNGAVDGGGIYVTGLATLSVANNTTFRANRSSGDGGGIFTQDYSYTDPADRSRYANVALDSTTLFHENLASEAYRPPTNAADFSNVEYAQTSILDRNGYLHPFNNYDINYVGTPPSLSLFNVTYDANEGVGGHVDTNITADVDYLVRSVNDTGISREAHSFTGWNTTPDGTGVPYNEDQQIQLTKNLLLYAQWDNTAPPNGGGSGRENKPSGRQIGDIANYNVDEIDDVTPPLVDAPDTGSPVGIIAAIWLGVACLTIGLFFLKKRSQFRS